MMDHTGCSGSRRRTAVLMIVAIVAGTAFWRAEAGAADVSTITQVSAQPANGKGALVRWTPTTPAPGYLVETFDVTSSKTSPIASAVCFSCTTHRVSDLALGRRYEWTVVPVASVESPTPVGSPVTTNVVQVAADARPSPLVSVSATVRPGHIIEVSWKTATTGQAADNIDLQQWSIAGAFIRSVRVNADEPMKQLHVGDGASVIAGIGMNSSGRATAVWSNAVDVPVGCATADVCVDVDSAITASPQTLPGQGFLLSTRSGAVTADPTAAAALRPKHWRVGGSEDSNDTAALGAQPTLMVSGRWFQDTQATNGGYAALPWANWNAYRSFVTSLVSSARAGGWAPEYWDLANEPDGLRFSPKFFSPATRGTATAANVLQMLLVTYEAIKAADPTAKIVGPSVGIYVDAFDAPTDRINMGSFLSFAAANNMRLDAVSWHENAESASWQDTTMLPVIVADHVQRVRRLLAKYPQVGNPAVFINEHGPQSVHMLPGWIVGYLGQFDSAGVAQANRTCWSTAECYQPTFDGLLTATGNTWQGTTPAYWVHKLYADMEGATRMTTMSSVQWRVGAAAVRSDATSTVRVLLGQHWGCARAAGNTWCPRAFDPGSISASVSVAWPYTGSDVTVTVHRIPAGIAAIAGPSLVSTQRVAVVNGRVVVPLVGVGDGDAFSVVVTP